MIAVVASGAAAVLMQGDLADHVPAVLIAAVLMVAVLFGLSYGLLAATAAAAVYALFGLPLPSIDMRSGDARLLMLFGAGALLTGFYTDRVRRRERHARSLLGADRILSAVQGQAPAAHVKRPAKVWPDSILKEARSAFASLCILGAGLAAGWLAQDILGPPCGLLLILASVVVVAGLLGARFGLTAGILAILTLAAFSETATGVMTPSGVAAFSLLVFAAVGWGVGRVADELRRERESLEALVSASRDLSSSTDETTIRSVLFENLSKIAQISEVELRDENDAALRSAVAGAEPVGADSGWRERRLSANGRDVGAARWRVRGSGQNGRLADEIATSLIELGAAAIVRARLSAEKAEMEFVARTEHLRTILLDAVSHHFRSPLAGIIGSVTSILNLPDQHDRDVRRELLLIIKEQANRLNRYVDNFLSVARLESGSIDINPKPVALESLIYDVWETFGEAGGARRFLRVSVDPEPIHTDEALMGQVLGNLMENAIKFSSEGSVIDVRSRLESGRVVIEVLDQGCGVPAKSHSRIFDRFFRSPGAKSPGLGLGLYIARSLIEMLGGAVQAHNRSDGEPGLMVTITLPQAE